MDEGRHRRSLEITRGLQCDFPEETSTIIETSYSNIDPFINLHHQTISESLQVFSESLQRWYNNTRVVTNATVSDIKTLWIITSGNHLHKGKVVGKLLAYYLIVIGIYLIQVGFWINIKIIKLILDVIMNQPRNNRRALGILFSILMALLLGATISAACDD
ncbi:uncharacterized protein [Chelonus insularis]|uniref:uncharacterized protein n=1 Tax=Chelonus insularis TaxID=460826 RepID=UPI00158CE641|nr:uncharacterized protein LOC118072258 [Chelonus insularis]